ANKPNWLTNGHFCRGQLIAILRDHIHTVVGRYRGRVAQWDVVNEGISGGFWLDGIGPDYVDMAFRFAHEADASAKLFYNDTDDEGLGGRANAVYDAVKALKARGVPIDGVGLEAHFDLNSPPLSDVVANMRRLKDLGLEV